MKKAGPDALELRMADAMNTHNPALVTLRAKGYELWLEVAEDEADPSHTWWARQSRREFAAASPLGLLGLVALWEHRGDDWRRSDDPDLYEELMSAAYPDP